MGGWVVDEKAVGMRCCGREVGGWVKSYVFIALAGPFSLRVGRCDVVGVAGGTIPIGGWVGWWVDEKVEERKTVGMRCCKLGLGGWVGGWVDGRTQPAQHRW